MANTKIEAQNKWLEEMMNGNYNYTPNSEGLYEGDTDRYKRLLEYGIDPVVARLNADYNYMPTRGLGNTRYYSKDRMKHFGVLNGETYNSETVNPHYVERVRTGKGQGQDPLLEDALRFNDYMASGKENQLKKILNLIGYKY